MGGLGGGASQEKFSNFRVIFDDFVTLKERKKNIGEKNKIRVRGGGSYFDNLGKGKRIFTP